MIARGIVRRGSITSSPSVAIRPYPVNATNISAQACKSARGSSVIHRFAAATSGAPATTNAASATSVTDTITIFTRFDSRTPQTTTIVSAATIPTAIHARHAASCPSAVNKYPANPSAAVAADALFAHKNIHPAANPSHGRRYLYPYSYVPPLTGWLAASCALLSALHVATPAASTIASTTFAPATPAARPMLTNTPVPMIEPSPIITAPNSPTSRRSPWSFMSSIVLHSAPKPPGAVLFFTRPLLTSRHNLVLLN